jgi:hypothetical protein
MEVRIMGDPDGGPSVDLDHTRFSYAGKFVMTAYGKAIAEIDGSIGAAIAFNRDRTDESTVWFRYLTVRNDLRAAGIGAKVSKIVADRLLQMDISGIKIAVNNPYAYEACYKAGFGFTGEETGLAELVLRYPDDGSDDRYGAGLKRFLDRDLSDEERRFAQQGLGSGSPAMQSENPD